MSIDINKHETDIDILKKQNVNDLLSIKQLYRKLDEIEKKLTQIKYIDSNLANKLKKEYENLKRVILDENIQVELKNKIEETKNIQVELKNKIEETKTELSEVSSQMEQTVRKGEGGSVTWAMTSQDFRENVTGGNTAVVGKDSVLTENIVDKQVTPIKTDFFTYENIMTLKDISVGSINSVGSVNTSSTNMNISDFIPVIEGYEYLIPGYIRYYAFYNVNQKYITDSRVADTTNAKIIIPSDVKYIRVNWYNSTHTVSDLVRTDESIKIYNLTNGIKLLKQFAENSIDVKAINGLDVEDKIDDNIYFSWVGDTFRTLTIYMKTICDNAYVGYRFKHLIESYDADNSSSNYDVWRLRGVSLYTKNTDNTFTDILDGAVIVHEASEWECAIKETGKTDFVGGSTHGDEFIESIVFFLDGVPYINPSDFSEKACKELRIIRKSKLYRADENSSVHIADHYVDYLFKNNEITIDNRIDWKVDTNCGISYLCMLGARRLNGTTQITNKALKSGDGSILDVSREGHINNKTTKRCTKAYLWNDGSNGGLNVNMSIEILENNFFPNFNFKFDNRAEYNKFYFDQCGANFEVKTGDIWFNKAKYKIDYLGEY